MEEKKFNTVWDALFDDPGEKKVLEIKSNLMDEISNYLKRESLTQEQAAKKFGVSQPRISDISTGKISKFTIDALVSILTNAGIDIEVFPKNKNFLIEVPEQRWKLRLLPGGKKKRKVGAWDTEVSVDSTKKDKLRSGHDDEYALEA